MNKMKEKINKFINKFVKNETDKKTIIIITRIVAILTCILGVGFILTSRAMNLPENFPLRKIVLLIFPLIIVALYNFLFNRKVNLIYKYCIYASILYLINIISAAIFIIVFSNDAIFLGLIILIILILLSITTLFLLIIYDKIYHNKTIKFKPDVFDPLSLCCIIFSVLLTLSRSCVWMFNLLISIRFNFICIIMSVMNVVIVIGMIVMVIKKQKLYFLLCIALFSSITELIGLYTHKKIGLFILCIIVIGMTLTCMIAKIQSGYIEETQEESQEESYVE